MKTLPADRLDRDTPNWPEVRITLGDNTTVTVSGVITPVADEAAALARTAAQARTLGRPIRARLTTVAGAHRKLIVAADGAVTELDSASPVTIAKTPATRQHATAAPPAARKRASTDRKSVV